MAASTAVVTIQDLKSIKLYTIAWTSDSAAATIDNVLKDSDSNNILFNGMLARVIIVPDVGGTQPDNNYKMEILDAAGIDVLAAQGATLHESNKKNFVPLVPATDGTTVTGVPFTLASTLTLDGESAGNSKTGTIYLIVS